MSKNKGITFDGFSDKWIKYTQMTVIGDLWRRDTLESFKFGQARLIPLNKAYPGIPTRSQFRPIVVLSPLFKWLELRFLKLLQDFCSNHLLA